MTQAIQARRGIITPEMVKVAEKERLDVEFIRQGVTAGNIVILRNNQRGNVEPVGVGKGLRTKVNASIGTSPEHFDMDGEMHKLEVAVKAGADTIMELSSGGDINAVRKMTLARTKLPVGTVPIYQAAIEATDNLGGVVNMNADQMFAVIERHAADGADFMALHCAINHDVIERLRNQPRVTDVVSRGGAFLTGWMLHNQKENPLYEQFDRILEIALKYDVTLSVGDAIRPGAIADSLDRAQVQGLILVGELVKRALDAGVQVMVEGPGHVPADQIQATILLQKQLCHKVPYFILGNLVTDIAPGYDHITSAIGGTIAAIAGADYICYVTPAEHLRLPTAEDVHEGVIAARIATHAADLVKGAKGAWEWDLEMSKARKALDWDKQISLAIDPEKARRYRAESNSDTTKACSMCGDFCAMKVVSQYLGTKTSDC